VAYAPADDPQIAVAVIVEHGGHGGAAAAPVARKVIEEYLKNAGPTVVR
jgi:penicillin-binding protein 2